jgi:hypothetical protein
MKTLIYTTIFAMLLIISFLVWWALAMFSYAGSGFLSDTAGNDDRVQLSQLYNAKNRNFSFFTIIKNTPTMGYFFIIA